MPKIIHNGITYAGLPDIDYDCEISNVTLYAANWDSTTKVYTISDARIDSDTIQQYLPAVGITDTQLEALQAANIVDAGQDSGHAYLKAYGDVPAIDIPIRIVFNPGVKTKDVIPSAAYGDSDISGIGDGTITGAISSLNSNIGDYFRFIDTIDLIAGASKTITDLTRGLYLLATGHVYSGNALYMFAVYGGSNPISVLKVAGIDALTITKDSATFATMTSITITATENVRGTLYKIGFTS